MKPKFEKLSASDFDIPAGLIPPSTQPPASEQRAVYESDPPDVKVADLSDAPATSTKATKGKKAKAVTGISIRLTFNTQDYKSLSMLALTESEKVNKRVSVTSLLLTQANKLIKKGNTNA